MKDTIIYNYNMDIEDIEEGKLACSFFYDDIEYYFSLFNRSTSDINDLINIIGELKSRGIRVHDFVLNKYGNIITKYGNDNYVLLRINSQKTNEVTFEEIITNTKKFKLNSKNSRYYKNNWGELWGKKIDYMESQISELGHNKKIIVNSFSYYVGLTENAISYVNKINKIMELSDLDMICLSHRRIFFPNINLNYLNPLTFIFDLNVRDIAEYLKIEFFNGEDSFKNLEYFLKYNKLTDYSYHMLYGRLLYPSYYFDIYEDIMNNNESENKLLKVIDKIEEYEIFLKRCYDEINKYTRLEKIDWIIKKVL